MPGQPAPESPWGAAGSAPIAPPGSPAVQVTPEPGWPQQQIPDQSGLYGQPPASAQPYSAPGNGFVPPGAAYPPQAPGTALVPAPTARKSRAPLITMLVLCAALVLGGGAVIMFGPGHDDTEPTSSGSGSATPSESESPSPEPTTDAPTTEEPTSQGGAISEADFGDWDFKLGDVELFAAKVDGWDYDSCGGVEVGSALTDLGCVTATEVTYEAEDGELKLTNLFFEMSDETSASTAVEDKEFDDQDFIPQETSMISDFDYGRYRANSAGPVIVVTLCTATSSVDEDDADEYLDEMNADQAAALAFSI